MVHKVGMYPKPPNTQIIYKILGTLYILTYIADIFYHAILLLPKIMHCTSPNKRMNVLSGEQNVLEI